MKKFFAAASRIASASILGHQFHARGLAARLALLCTISFWALVSGPAPTFAQPKPADSAEQSSGSSLTDAKVDEEALAKDSSTEINVKNADITAIIRIFSKKTHRNFILDDRVKGKVSIYLPGKVSEEESTRILDSVLGYKGFASVPIGANLWKIVPAKEARTSTIPTQKSGPSGKPSAEVVTRLIQLKFVAADEVRQLVSQLISTDGFISAYSGTNSLIVIDSEDNIARLMEIISTLDVPFSNREMTIIPVVNAQAKDIAEKLNEILGTGSEKGSSQANAGSSLDFGLELARARVRQMAAQTNAAVAGAPGGAPGGAPQSGLTGSGSGDSSNEGQRSMQPKIIADERTNAIIVVADEDTTARVRALVSQLDSKVDLSGSQYWIYRCQHAKADELAEVLGGLVGKGGGSSKKSGSDSIGGLNDTGSDLISGGSSRTSSRSSGSQSRLRGQNRTPGRSRNEGRSSGGATSVELSEDLSITADPATNTLIIYGSKSDYQKIKSLLEKLDVKRRQVLVEAILLEVGVEDNKTTDVSWLTSGGGKDGGILASNNANNITSLLQSPAGIQDFAIAAASAGTLTIGGGNNQITLPTQTVLLNAVRRNSNVNVLSAPTVLTTDNEQAEIVVGSNVPFVSSTASNDQNLGNTFNQVDRQDVGITLRLTPQISSGDSVTLKIFTEVSSVTSIDPKLGPTTSIRTSETSVITKDSQMIVIGGLMSDSINESERGVPYLKDIPVLGHLFKTSIEQRQRTNLLILITPRIIRDQYDARDSTIASRDRLEQDFKANDVYPDREEYLRSPAIDKVSEGNTYDGPLPSTIFQPQSAPEKASEINKARDSIAGGEQSAATPSEDKVPEFKVNPRFAPGAETSSPNGTQSKEEGAPEQEPKGRLNSSAALSPEHTAPSGDRFIVLKFSKNSLKAGGNALAELPFGQLAKDGVVAIKIPSDSGIGAREFFKVGAQRRYEAAGVTYELTSVGVFPNADDAEALFPEIKALHERGWYTLSPYEIMSLGDGPWK